MSRQKLFILPKLNDRNGDLNKKWFVFYSCRDPRDGKMKRKQIYKPLHKYKTKSERYQAAEELIEKELIRLKRGYNPWVNDEEAVYSDSLEYKFAARVFGRVKASNKNFNYYASLFIKKELSGLDEETIGTYTGRLRTFNMFLHSKRLGDADITVLDNNIAVDFFNYLIDERKLSGGVTKAYKQILTRLFQFLINEGKLYTSPIVKIPENTRVIDKTPRPIKDSDLLELKTELQKDDQLWLAVQFEYYCYLRPTKEIRLMQIKWIDFSAGTITIPKTIMKTKRDKIVTIPNVFLKKLISEYRLNQYYREFYVFGRGGEPNELHLGKSTLRQKFNKTRDRVGMPIEYKLYSWKHTGNIAAKKAGIPLIERMFNNGHTSEKTTEIYDKHIGAVELENIKTRFPEI